ncbi:MAG: hypothetical protein OXM59_01080 [Gammaproteobacteria bacterium]|nr:hypothetical protein [Gammaproteobacteria bacterium]
MGTADITASTQRPKVPAADFAFYVDFRKGEGPASRVFAATHEFIQACQQVDKALLTSIDSSIETVMVLEDIEAASLKTWLRTVLTAADDQALKSLNWKPAVGKYLVRAKYMILRWIEDDENPRDLRGLRNEIQQLAKESDVRHLPDYPPVNSKSLISAVTDLQEVKDHLAEGDKASVEVPGEGEVKFNLSMRIPLESLEELAVSTTETHTVNSMYLIVKKPDYLGESMWEFRLGSRSINAKIEDKEWLTSFQGRQVDVRPGDALDCTVRVVMMYDHDNELLSEKHFVERVRKVLDNRSEQLNLLKKDE